MFPTIKGQINSIKKKLTLPNAQPTRENISSKILEEETATFHIQGLSNSYNYHLVVPARDIESRFIKIRYLSSEIFVKIQTKFTILGS